MTRPKAEPTFDKDGYPTPATLRRIRTWACSDPIAEAIGEWMLFCQRAWYYPDRFVRSTRRRKRRWWDKTPRWRWYVSTGGWSGNEDIINAMQRNWIMWSLTWVRHDTGGHYWFDTP